jgi:hypothetical protein
VHNVHLKQGEIKMRTIFNGMRGHFSFFNDYTPTVNLSDKSFFRSLRTNGRRGVFKGLTKKQTLQGSIVLLSTVPETSRFHKDLVKLRLKYLSGAKYVEPEEVIVSD